MYLEMVSRISCPITFPGVEVKLSGLYSPDLPSSPSWRQEWHLLFCSSQFFSQSPWSKLTENSFAMISPSSHSTHGCIPLWLLDKPLSNLLEYSLTWFSSSKSASSLLQPFFLVSWTLSDKMEGQILVWVWHGCFCFWQAWMPSEIWVLVSHHWELAKLPYFIDWLCPICFLSA